MNTNKNTQRTEQQVHFPTIEEIQSELATAASIDDFIGKNGISARLFAGTRDIQDTLHELYGIDLFATTISAITDKVWPLVEVWQNRLLTAIYPIIFLDAIHAVFPQTEIQRCVIHQIRHSLKYIA